MFVFFTTCIDERAEKPCFMELLINLTMTMTMTIRCSRLTLIYLTRKCLSILSTKKLKSVAPITEKDLKHRATI